MRPSPALRLAARNKGSANLWSSVSVSASRITPRRGDGSRFRAQAGTPRLAAGRAANARFGMRRMLAGSRAVVVLAVSLACSACGTLSGVSNMLGSGSGPQPGQAGYVQGFLGSVVADEPHAVLAGRQVLSRGGDAADAAVAVALNLAVTLPSRAGLGGGGACLAYAAKPDSINGGVPDAVLFVPAAPSQSGTNADRPAALPMLARGMYLLHARYGKLPFETLVVSAEEAARFGVPVSRALERDLAPVSGPLFADPAARAVFSRNGAPLAVGQTLVQPALATTLAELRVAGVGDFYQGVLAHRLAENSPLAGGPLTVAELRASLPKLAPALTLAAGNDQVAFLPPPADGGLAAAAAFDSLLRNPNDPAGAAARGLAVAAAWRAGGVTADALLHAASLQPAGMPPLPASTSFATLDRDGNAVVCGLTMNNLFGTGRMVPNMGFLLAASPASVSPPLLAAALAWNKPIHAFRAAVGGSGQAGAPMAVAVGMLNALHTDRPMAAAVPEPGRANVIECRRYLPGENGSCAWAADPRDSGIAIGGGD